VIWGVGEMRVSNFFAAMIVDLPKVENLDMKVDLRLRNIYIFWCVLKCESLCLFDGPHLLDVPFLMVTAPFLSRSHLEGAGVYWL
jgi:hypothetical protein